MRDSNHAKEKIGSPRVRRAAFTAAGAGIGAALLSVCAWITVPLGPVPFTLQTLGVFLIAGLLQSKGIVAVGVYLLCGAVGLPVCAGFRGGPAVLLGPTGGYLVGFLLAACIYAFAVRRFGEKAVVCIIAGIAALAADYAFGTIWFAIVYTRQTGAVTVGQVLAWCVLPFILPDAVKLGLALALSRAIRRALPQNVREAFL